MTGRMECGPGARRVEDRVPGCNQVMSITALRRPKKKEAPGGPKSLCQVISIRHTAVRFATLQLQSRQKKHKFDNREKKSQVTIKGFYYNTECG